MALRRIYQEDNTLPTWALLSAALICEFLFRFMFVGVVGLDRPDCAFEQDYWLHQENNIPSIFDQYRAIWLMVSLLAGLEVFRCILFRWSHRSFILTVNIGLCLICFALFFYLNKASQLFAYERGEIAFEEQYFQPPDDWLVPDIPDELISPEFEAYHFEQCRLRVELGAPHGDISLRENAIKYKAMGGEVFQNNMYWWGDPNDTYPPWW